MKIFFSNVDISSQPISLPLFAAVWFTVGNQTKYQEECWLNKYLTKGSKFSNQYLQNGRSELCKAYHFLKEGNKIYRDVSRWSTQTYMDFGWRQATCKGEPFLHLKDCNWRTRINKFLHSSHLFKPKWLGIFNFAPENCQSKVSVHRVLPFLPLEAVKFIFVRKITQ